MCNSYLSVEPQIAKFMEPAWGPPGCYRPQIGPPCWPHQSCHQGRYITRINHTVRICYVGFISGHSWCNQMPFSEGIDTISTIIKRNRTIFNVIVTYIASPFKDTHTCFCWNLNHSWIKPKEQVDQMVKGTLGNDNDPLTNVHYAGIWPPSLITYIALPRIMDTVRVVFTVVIDFSHTLNDDFTVTWRNMSLPMKRPVKIVNLPPGSLYLIIQPQ